MTYLSKLSDRELLELAAEAGNLPWAQWVEDGDDSWNSLQDPGDALSLAAASGIDVLFRVVGGCRVEVIAPGRSPVVVRYERDADRLDATCRAITLAAAAIALAKRGEA